MTRLDQGKALLPLLPGSCVRLQVLRECHGGPLGGPGHFGRAKTGSLRVRQVLTDSEHQLSEQHQLSERLG